MTYSNTLIIDTTSAISRRRMIKLVAGDTAPPLSVQFVGLDMADYTTLNAHIKKEDNTRFTRTLVPDGSDEELATITWQTGDLVTGEHLIEFELTDAGGGVTLPQDYPVILSVRNELF